MPAWNKCLEDTLPDGTEIGQSVDTDWTLAGAFDAGSALVSSGTDFGAIFYDYADPIPQVVEAYSKGGKKIPAIITLDLQQRHGPGVGGAARDSRRVRAVPHERASPGRAVPRSPR